MDEIYQLQAEVLKTLASPRRLEILHRLAAGRQHDDAQIAARRIGAQRVADVVAVPLGHHHVEQHQVRRVGGDLLEQLADDVAAPFEGLHEDAVGAAQHPRHPGLGVVGA